MYYFCAPVLFARVCWSLKMEALNWSSLRSSIRPIRWKIFNHNVGPCSSKCSLINPRCRLCISLQRVMRELVDSKRYETHDGFTVVLQPFMREVYLPMTEVRRPPPDACLAARVSQSITQFSPLIEGRPPWSLLLHPRLLPSQPEGSHPDGSRSLEQHGRIPWQILSCPTSCPHHNQLSIFQLEPVGNKTFTQDFEVGIELKCPSTVISTWDL